MKFQWYWRGLRDFEAIAKSPDCGQKDRFVRLEFNLLAQAAHVNVHRAGRHEMLLAPDLAQKLLARKSVPGMREKELQQFELGGRQFHLVFILIDAPRGLIETERTKRYFRRFRGGFRLQSGEDEP